MNITRHPVELTIHDNLRVTATGPDGQTARGRLAHSGGSHDRIYPRIEFTFNQAARWIEPYCDHRYWILDDAETGAETEQRPTDTGTFDLTLDETAQLQIWHDAHQPAAAPEPTAKPNQPIAPIEPIFAIGGLNRGDGAELPQPEPRFGQACRICGQSESQGARFTTIAGGDVCDDCL